MDNVCDHFQGLMERLPSSDKQAGEQQADTGGPVQQLELLIAEIKQLQGMPAALGIAKGAGEWHHMQTMLPT